MSKKQITLLLLVLIGGFLAVLTWFSLNPPSLFSDPSVPRPNRSYDAVTTPREPAPPLTSNVFGSVTIRSNSNNLEIIIPQPQAPGELDPFGFQLRKASPSHHVALPPGSLHLNYMAVAWNVPTTNFDYSVNVPARFFTPELEPIPFDQLSPRLNPWEATLSYRGEFPEVKFAFTASNLPPWKLLGMELFDARTKRTLSTGYSHSSNPDGFYLSTPAGLWHKAPVQAFIHLAHGEPHVVDIPVHDFIEKNFGPARVKLAGILPGYSSGTSSSNDGRTNRVQVNFSSLPTETNSAVVMMVHPRAYRAPLDFAAIDQDGNKLESRGSTTSDSMHLLNIQASPDRIKFVRVLHYPHISRLQFDLPYIPGLPPENDAVTNLFDLKVPYVRMRYQDEFYSNLGTLLQLDISFRNLNFPQGTFPLVYTNKTARQLLEDYLKFAPEQKQVRVDHESGTLEFRDPPLIEIWKKLKSLLPPN